MIRIPPQYNVTHPPGQVVYPIHEKPLTKDIEDYAVDMQKKALRDAFDEGWKVGYARGLSDSRRAQQMALNPNSEGSR